MRKRKYLIGATLGVLGAFVFSSTALAVPTSQSLSVVATPSKQKKKVFGIVKSFANTVDTTYTGGFAPPATQTVLTYSKDFKFTPGNTPQCPLASINNKPMATARGACAGSIIGGGSALLNGGALSAVVTAFNGQPQNGHPTIYLHSNVNNDFADPVLVGELNPSTNTLTVAINSAGLAITHFQTTIFKRKTGKAKNAYYVTARCRKGKWITSEQTTFANHQTLSASTKQKCKGTT
jgi:hypothetical protein